MQIFEFTHILPSHISHVSYSFWRFFTRFIKELIMVVTLFYIQTPPTHRFTLQVGFVITLICQVELFEGKLQEQVLVLEQTLDFSIT